MKTLYESILSSTGTGAKAYIKKWAKDTANSEKHFEEFLNNNDLLLKPADIKSLQDYIWNWTKDVYDTDKLDRDYHYSSTSITYKSRLHNMFYNVQVLINRYKSGDKNPHSEVRQVHVISFEDDKLLVLFNRQTQELINKIGSHFSKSDITHKEFFYDWRVMGQNYKVYKFDDLIVPFK